MIQPPYTTGIVRMTAGSAVVRGEGTAWVLGLVNGGLLTFGGRAVPIASVESNTQLTLANPSPVAFEGIYAIELGRADAASAIVANRRLLEYLDGIAAMSPLGAQIVGADTPEAARAILQVLGLGGGGLTGDLIIPRLRIGQNGNRTIVFENAVGEPRGYLFQDSSTSDLLLMRADGIGTIRLTSAGAQIDGSVIETRSRLEQYLAANAYLRPLDFPQSRAASGYVRLPGGVIVQWGRVEVSGTPDIFVPYPVAFPSYPASVTITPRMTPGGSEFYAGNVRDDGVNGFSVFRRYQGGSLTAPNGFALNWIATGY